MSWRSKPEKSINEVVAELSLPELWSVPVEEKLCAKEWKAKGRRGERQHLVPCCDDDVSAAIYKRQQELVEMEVQELIDKESELQELFSAPNCAARHPLFEKRDRLKEIYGELRAMPFNAKHDDEIDIVFPLANILDRELRTQRNRFGELSTELLAYGVDWGKREALEKFLREFLYRLHKLTGGHSGFWGMAWRSIGEFLETPGMQTPALTRYVLIQALYCIRLPYERLLERNEGWKHPYLVAALVATMGAIGLFYRPFWLFWLLWISLVIWAGTRCRAYLIAGRIWSDLKLISEEVQSRCYDREELAHRLRRVEEKGAVVPSVALSLLRLPSLPTTSSIGKDPRRVNPQPGLRSAPGPRSRTPQ